MILHDAVVMQCHDVPLLLLVIHFFNGNHVLVYVAKCCMCVHARTDTVINVFEIAIGVSWNMKF